MDEQPKLQQNIQEPVSPRAPEPRAGISTREQITQGPSPSTSWRYIVGGLAVIAFAGVVVWAIFGSLIERVIPDDKTENETQSVDSLSPAATPTPPPDADLPEGFSSPPPQAATPNLTAPGAGVESATPPPRGTEFITQPDTNLNPPPSNPANYAYGHPSGFELVLPEGFDAAQVNPDLVMILNSAEQPVAHVEFRHMDSGDLSTVRDQLALSTNVSKIRMENINGEQAIRYVIGGKTEGAALIKNGLVYYVFDYDDDSIIREFRV